MAQLASPRRLKWQVTWGFCMLMYGLIASTMQDSTATESKAKQQQVQNSVGNTPASTTNAPRATPASTINAPRTTPASTTNAPRTTPHGPTPKPTWRPRRENCTPPAIEQFPPPLMGPYWRKHGGLILHIIVCVYSFLGLAIVCDDYFVTSLDRICEEFKLSPDVAGATFMAAGSSAPELATVVIGVFFAKDDIGVSGVIGSAVFNIMFVISVCALFGGTVSYLNWWPLCRDCFFYAVSIVVMLCVIFDETISWGESSFMLMMYVVYCVALSYNAQLERWAQTWPVPCRTAIEEDLHLVSYKHLDSNRQNATNYSGTAAVSPSEKALDFGTPAPPQQQLPPMQNQQPGQPGNPKPDYYKAKDPNPNQASPLIKPENADLSTHIQWAMCVPVHYMCQATMPDCRTEQYRRWYPFTFLVSMIWISFYSYIMVWMITVIGSTLGIPDTVMGLTFVAAGVSVPDALSSLAVVKEGYGDMAVSNAVGSNVFDILVCLGLPWFIQTAFIKPGSHVNVYSKGLTYSTLSLLSTVVFLIVATHMNGWKLDKKYGVILMVWYLLFIAFASLYELNVFGEMNPPECQSNY